MIVPTVNYSLRIDESDKQKAEQVFKSLGMTFSTGINIYLKAVGRQQRIPFDLALDSKNSTVSATQRDDKEKSFRALDGILAGYEVNLKNERETRMLSK